jgi:TolB-like protein/DNA-binding winged helix-turn-helix (wHTH) protein/Tfp pilus assembly protein PilF
MQSQGQTGTVLLPGDILVPRQRPDVRMQRSLLKGFYLHDLLIEPTSGTVSGPDGDQHLKPKAIEVLLYLAERPFELVERQALLEAVWGEDQGSQEALSHAVSELRSGLGDQADDPQLIQTIPTRGYRLLRKPRFVDGPDTGSKPEVADEHGFIGSLMRRGVVQAGLAYLIFSWLLIQVADAVTPILGLPAWFPLLITYSAIGGFPIVLILAWLLEQSDGHLFLDRGKQSGRMLSGLERNYLSIFVAYIIAVIGASTYQAVVGFDVPTANGVIVAEEDTLLPVRPNSIAVLRFLNINNSETAKAFGEGLGEDILDRLARIPGLSVSSRGDSWSLPDNASSDVVRKRLRVAYFLEGSVRLIGDDLRVVVQLIESATGFHIVSRSFDAKVEDFVDVQREITDLAVANLRVALPEDAGTEFLTSAAGPDPDAYVLYRQGRALLDAPPTEESLAQAIDLFEQSLAIDSAYAAAHAGICRAHVRAYELTKDPDGIVAAEHACSEALNANPNLDVVYTALGTLRHSVGNMNDASTAFGQALELDPKNVVAMLGMAHVMQARNELDESERLLQQAIDLQPGNWRSINELGSLYFFTGRYPEAAHAYRQVVFLDPENWLGHGNLGSALMMTGDFAAAVEPLNNSLKIEKDAYFLSSLGTIYYYLGEYDRSVETHRQAAELMPEANFVWMNLGDALRFSSYPDQAGEAYAEAIQRSTALLEVDPNSAFDVIVKAWATAATGDAETAKILIERALQLAPNDPYVRYYDGLLKYGGGEKLAAINAMRAAVEMGYPVAMLAADPLLGELHGDNRFERVLAKKNNAESTD